MTTTQHQVTIRFTTDDAEETDVEAAIRSDLVKLCDSAEDAGAFRIRTRHETRRDEAHGYRADPDEDGDEA